jgi:hypothetical protein
MIAASQSQDVAYLWEPFSPLARPGIRDVPFDRWFIYVCEENQGVYEPGLRRMLAYDYRWLAEVRAMRRPRDVGRAVRDANRFRQFRARHARPLLKDPIALFSAGWIADHLDADVVVLIRHPAAFVHSIVQRRLRHPFEDFTAQPLLMRDVLAPFQSEIEEYARHEQPLLDQGILLWRLLHHAIAAFRTQRADWLFLRLEDIGMDPQGRFEEIFAGVEVPLDDGVRARIRRHSDASNPDQVTDMASTVRNSREAVMAWKRSLTLAEVATIRARVEPLASAFYGPEDW